MFIDLFHYNLTTDASYTRIYSNKRRGRYVEYPWDHRGGGGGERLLE